MLFLAACESADPRIISDEDIADIEVDVNVVRLDQATVAAVNAFEADTSLSDSAIFASHYASMKPFIVDNFYFGNDSIGSDSQIAADFGWILRDSIFRVIVQEVDSAFPAGYPFEEKLSKPLKRFKFVFPEQPLPKFGAYISGFPKSGMAGTDQYYVGKEYFGFGLHYFMGPNYKFYPQDLPQYLRRSMDEDYLEVTLMNELAARTLPRRDPTKLPRLIDEMIREGKRLYFLQIMLPERDDSIRMDYSAKQINWAIYHEARIYKLLAGVMFEKSVKHIQDYIAPKPYTTELSLESAPRIGQFCGWMIIRAYMARHPEVSLPELMAMTDADLILRESAYKPELTE